MSPSLKWMRNRFRGPGFRAPGTAAPTTVRCVDRGDQRRHRLEIEHVGSLRTIQRHQRNAVAAVQKHGGRHRQALRTTQQLGRPQRRRTPSARLVSTRCSAAASDRRDPVGLVGPGALLLAWRAVLQRGQDGRLAKPRLAGSTPVALRSSVCQYCRTITLCIPWFFACAPPFRKTMAIRSP